MQVASAEEASAWLGKGAQARACAETAHNEQSSRSHSLVLVGVQGRCKLTGAASLTELPSVIVF